MGNCPICYNGLTGDNCSKCGLQLTNEEMLKLKADTYDSIIGHLLTSGMDSRRREQARCKIALRNIQAWAKQNKDKLTDSEVIDPESLLKQLGL